MAFWTNLLGGSSSDTVTPNDNGPEDITPGDPDGIEFTGEPVESRSLPIPLVSPWDGWPSNWDTPNWQINGGIQRLVDIAWACLDLNSNIISAMPVYQLRNGQIIPAEAWMTNPDPDIYTCWQEFARQLFWDYQLGEAFVLPFATSGGYPSRFRVIPPFLVKVELIRGKRYYEFAGHDVTDEILHIRYHTNIIDPRGHGPLEVAGARLTTISLLQRYVTTLAETGGVPLYWIGVDRRLQSGEANDLLTQWMDSRSKNIGQPAILGSKATLNQAKTMDAKEMALMELTQFSEARVAILLGVPPFLVGLAGGDAGGSVTYSNVESLFDYHDRSSLRPKSNMVMQAVSGWALPNGRSCELNRDDYTRLPLDKRAMVYKNLGPVEGGGIGVLTIDEIRILERFYGSATTSAATALTGGTS